MAVTQLNELGFYTLAGPPRSPADLIEEVRDGEALGLGAAFVSERHNIEEAATLSGAVASTRWRRTRDGPSGRARDRGRVVTREPAVLAPVDEPRALTVEWTTSALRAAGFDARITDLENRAGGHRADERQPPGPLPPRRAGWPA